MTTLSGRYGRSPHSLRRQHLNRRFYYQHLYSRISHTQRLRLLIALNFIWSGSALWYDAPVILQLPLWSLPFIVICPVYPLLLGVYWWQVLRQRLAPPLLTAGAVLPSALYGALAFIFYPLAMREEGYSPYAAAQLAWVAFYGFQGWYILSTKTLPSKPVRWVTLFLAVSLLVLWNTHSYGYINLAVLSGPALNALLAIGLALLMVAIPGINARTASVRLRTGTARLSDESPRAFAGERKKRRA
jgi:hypothetical protein